MAPTCRWHGADSMWWGMGAAGPRESLFGGVLVAALPPPAPHQEGFEELHPSSSLISDAAGSAYCRLEGLVSGRTVRPAAESSISVASRLSRVTSCLALTTHQIAALRYPPAWA